MLENLFTIFSGSVVPAALRLQNRSCSVAYAGRAKILTILRGIPAFFVASAHRLQPQLFEHTRSRAKIVNGSKELSS